MSTRLRVLPYLLVLALTSVLAAACGGEEPASSATDVDTLLRDTFAADQRIDSGRLSLSLDVDAKGTAGLAGPIAIRVAGPFARAGEDAGIPQFALDLSFAGAGQQLKAGLTSTGEKAFVSFQDAHYAVPALLFAQLEASYEQARKDQAAGGGQQGLATLGIDPRTWLKNPVNAGEADVGGVETIRITGDVDVAALLVDVNRAIERAGSLGGGAAGRVPDTLTEAQQRQVREAVKRLDVEIFTGREDRILRRLRVVLELDAPAGTKAFEAASVVLDLQLTEVGEKQEIEAPEDARPLDELLGRLGGLGLGGLGAGGAGSGGGSGSGAGGGGASGDDLRAYAACIRDAGGDAGAARECARLLGP